MQKEMKIDGKTLQVQGMVEQGKAVDTSTPVNKPKAPKDLKPLNEHPVQYL